jgi:hypothetical protein
MDIVKTLTYCDRAENHIGMEQIGKLASEGFSLKDLEIAQSLIGGDIIKLECIPVCDGEHAVDGGCNNEDCRRKKLCVEDCVTCPCLRYEYKVEDAYILLIRKGVSNLGVDLDALNVEQSSLKPDTKAFMYGRVVNKHARGNLCFGDEGHEADYENKKGTVISYDEVPLTNKIRNKLEDIFGEKGKKLECEGNYYFDTSKCGIGFHGDAERRKVVAVRLGGSMCLHYQWFLEGKAIGKRIKFMLNHGDMYVMSDKAVGFDWKKKKIATLRHAAGANKFLVIKE